MTAPLGICPRCRVEVMCDLPNRCMLKDCPPIQPLSCPREEPAVVWRDVATTPPPGSRHPSGSPAVQELHEEAFLLRELIRAISIINTSPQNTKQRRQTASELAEARAKLTKIEREICSHQRAAS